MKKEPSFIGYGSSTSEPKEDAAFHRDAMGLDQTEETAALERAREQMVHQGEQLAEELCNSGDGKRAFSVFSLLLYTWPHHPHASLWQERLSSLGS